MRNKKDNTVYLYHIKDAISKIREYTSRHSYEEFINNEWDQDAIVRNLEIIGEAANNIDQSVRQQYPVIPWRKIIDFRNVVAHDYADLDTSVVWEIISRDLVELSSQIEKIID